MKKLAAFLGTAASLFAVQSQAAVDPAITTAITGGTTDGTTIAGALLVFVISVGVVLYLKRKAG